MKTLFKLALGLLITLSCAVLGSSFFEVPMMDALSVLMSMHLILFVIRMIVLAHRPADAARPQVAYGIAIEFWEQTIAEFLMREYPWIMRAKDRTGNVLNGAVVHIPQAGSLPGARRNRNKYPAPVVRRNDSEITYVLDEISTNPSHIKHAETVELSYDKVASVFGDHIKQLNYLSAFNILYRWAGKNPVAGGVTNLDLAAANIVRTTGATAATHLSGATGNRKVLQMANIRTAKTTLINQTKREVNAGKRALVLDETMYNQLKADTALDTFDKREMEGVVMQNGDIIRVAGFDVIRTDVLPRFTNAGTPLAKEPLSDADIGADESFVPYQNTAAASDNACALLLDFDYLHFAKGTIEVFETLRDAQNQGDIYSALVRVGASRERADQAGIVAIVQEP